MPFVVRLESLLLATSLLWTIGLNRGFFVAALRDQPFSLPATWQLALALALIVTALHALLLAALSTRRSVKPAVALLTLAGAFSMHYMNRYGVVIEPSTSETS